MDSNFQVRISADISALEKSIKEAQSTLNTLKSTTDSTTGSFNTMAQSASKVGVDMNRARLATFAFGQVIRDAGFFSQSFGLGVLAISNNIPILIDQLVLLSGVSAGFGAALSVIGSALAAGLTVFAYWAQGVERNGGTVSGAINKMANDSEGAIGRLVEYLNTPPASNMLASAVAGIEESVSLIKQIIGAAVDFSITVWQNFGTDISAVFKIFYGIVYNTMNNVLNIFRFASSLIKGDFGGALEAIGNIAKNVINNIIGLIQSFVRISSTLLGAVVGVIDPLKGEIIKNAGRELSAFGESLKFSSNSASEASFNFKDFLNDLFKGQKQVDKTKESVDKLNKSLREPALPKQAYVKEPFERPIWMAPKGKEVKKVDLMPSGLGMHEAEALKQMVLEMIRIEQQIDDIMINGIARTIGEAMMSIGQAFASGGDIGKAFGSALLGTLSGVLSQFGDMLIAASLAGLTFSKAFKSLFDPKNWALALAAGVALKVTAGALGGFSRNLSGGGGSMASGGQASPTPSFGGISSFSPNTSMTNSVGMTANSQPVLETRVSGNDLVILMNRSSNARNNYY